MTEKRMPTDQEIANALEIAGLSYSAMERPFYEPLPQPAADYVVAEDKKFANEIRRHFWIGIAIVTGVVIGAVAFIVVATLWGSG